MRSGVTSGWVLPPVRGRIGAGVMALYRVLAAITLVFVLASLVFNALDCFKNMPNSMALGFRTGATGRLVTVMAVMRTDTFDAGLRDGDRILAIDGIALPRQPTEFTIGARLGEGDGEARTLRVAGQDNSVRDVVLHTKKGAWFAPMTGDGMPLWAFSAIQFIQSELPAVVLLGASLTLFVRRPHDPEALFIAFAFLPMCYFADTAYWITAFTGADPVLFQLTTQIGMPLAFVAFAIMPDGRFSNPLCYAALAGFAVHLCASLWDFWAPVAQRLPPWIGTALLVLIPSIALAAALWRYVRTPDQKQRQQIKWAVIGMVVSFLGYVFGLPFFLIGSAGGVPGWMFIPVFLIQHVVSNVGMPLGLLAAMTSFRLYDAEVTITRSTAFAGLMVSLVAIFVASENLISGVGTQLVSHSLGPFAGGLAAALTAMAIGPVHTRFKSWADRSFRSHLFDMRERLPSLVGDLRETTGSQPLAQTIAHRVLTGMRARSVVLLLDDSVAHAEGVSTDAVSAWRSDWQINPAGSMESVRTDRQFPLRVPLEADGAGRVGWLLLGPRPDGSVYGKDEREALRTIADPVARALSISVAREKQWALEAAAAAAVDARFAELERVLARLKDRIA